MGTAPRGAPVWAIYRDENASPTEASAAKKTKRGGKDRFAFSAPPWQRRRFIGAMESDYQRIVNRELPPPIVMPRP
ncbi:hypothetical protein Enr13x_55580 [Stieleria neptunia]|uniref:Uncharacterized protein n=1 Tax=Stieleria neptunia TaxID=2527979 RepID=A0A518HXU1_9BACT|nr:hypothetical protein Enr13x_55580 [Stieleria neptunia]